MKPLAALKPLAPLKHLPKSANKAQKPDPQKVIGGFVRTLEKLGAKSAKPKK